MKAIGWVGYVSGKPDVSEEDYGFLVAERDALADRLAEAELLLDSAAHVIVDHGCSEISAAWIEQWGDRYEKFTSETVDGGEK